MIEKGLRPGGRKEGGEIIRIVSDNYKKAVNIASLLPDFNGLREKIDGPIITFHFFSLQVASFCFFFKK